MALHTRPHIHTHTDKDTHPHATYCFFVSFSVSFCLSSKHKYTYPPHAIARLHLPLSHAQCEEKGKTTGPFATQTVSRMDALAFFFDAFQPIDRRPTFLCEGLHAIGPALLAHHLLDRSVDLSNRGRQIPW